MGKGRTLIEFILFFYLYIMFNVLNQDGERIQVNKIDPQIHKHVTWRDFTEEEVLELWEAVEELEDEVAEEPVAEEEVAEEVTKKPKPRGKAKEL